MLRRLLLPVLVALAAAPAAHAAGGNYAFDGGARAQRSQVTAALNASSFDWGVVPGPVVIHIARDVASHASPNEIWLDSRLLESGRLAWGVVQHEYAHQVDFALLTDPLRAQLHPSLGGSSWWGAGVSHAELDCERFADLLAWAYWPSPDNVLRPESGAGVSPNAFRAELAGLLHLTPTRATAGVKGGTRPRKG